MRVREWGSSQPGCSWVSSWVSASVRRTHPTTMVQVTGKDTTGRKRTSRPRWAWTWALTREMEKHPNSQTPPASPGQIRWVVPTGPARGCAASASAQAHGDGTSGWLRQLTTGYGPGPEICSSSSNSLVPLRPPSPRTKDTRGRYNRNPSKPLQASQVKTKTFFSQNYMLPKLLPSLWFINLDLTPHFRYKNALRNII